MDKHQVIQIIIAALVTMIVFLLGLYIVYEALENVINKAQGICDNLTPETYNITTDHEVCKFNETTGKYDLNITVINEVRT